MTARFEKANDLLKKEYADYILITDSISAKYFSGFSSSNVVLLYSQKEKFLFTDFRYKTAADVFCKENGWKKTDICFNSFAENNIKGKVLFQDNFMSVENFENMKKTFKNSQFIAAGEEISAIFYAKTEEEINSVKKAAQIADISFVQFQKELKVGMSEFDAARILDIICLKNGSEKSAFDTIVLFGENSALPHGVPSRERKLKNGDVVLCDFGCVVDGFCSDMTRTICFGKANPNIKKIYDLVLEAQIIGVECVKAGVKASDIDKKVRGFIANAGFGENFGHGTGHSVGLRIHEKPAINKKDETILKTGMVITVEPGIYLPNEFGVRIEDLLVVTENGVEIITKTTKEIVEI